LSSLIRVVITSDQKGEDVGIEAIIFDLDGLMVDSEPLARQAWRALLAEHGHTLDRETFNAMLGLRLMDSSRLVKGRFDLPLTIEQIADRRSELFLASLPGNLQPMPGLTELLSAIDARGLRRAVATSSPGFYAPVALREIGAADGFVVIITGDSVARGKPAPDIYLAAAAALALPPAVCLALEDSPNGVRAAKAAGMCCIAVPNEQSAGLDLSEADAIMPSLGAIAGRLDEFLVEL
jgi:HAD superfamily hydrolase (TIGR01509 family)